jgi:hypothetical protein
VDKNMSVEGELKKRLNLATDNGYFDEDITKILDEAKQEFCEVLKDGETRLDELPLLIKKWFG